VTEAVAARPAAAVDAVASAPAKPAAEVALARSNGDAPLSAPPKPAVAHTAEPARPPAPAPVEVERNAERFVDYRARLITVRGNYMRMYATTLALAHDGSLYTHGLAVGFQGEHFRNAAYFGYGTEWGGGADTLQRFELSWECLWSPLAQGNLLNPYLGFRAGAMMVDGKVLTGNSMRPGLALAATAGLKVQPTRLVSLTVGGGYDANVGPDLGPGAGISGYALELGASLRF
jgi:hypothetical protein